MSLVETACPNCNKKIYLDLEEIISESSTRPIKCSQCGKEFIFGFDSDVTPISDDAENAAKKKTKFVKKVVVKKVRKQKPKVQKKVLVIEDSRLTREQICDLFEEEIAEVVKVDRAEHGFKSIKEKKPDLLIVDLVLPEMSGIDFITAVLKHIEPKKIVIFTAAMGMHSDIFESGMEGITLVQKGGADSYEELKEKGFEILGIDMK
ncbi:MAG: response regulator [Deltaproteobacteria bacterium]|uniref:Response regulator n=1 Tax=Candidatus Zymogenus saltonus TaxID=2844893 RepID=A0A9D8KF68_9DELT|nr:response regulator [Candidatus Zymogenus saltonus]